MKRKIHWLFAAACLWLGSLLPAAAQTIGMDKTAPQANSLPTPIVQPQDRASETSEKTEAQKKAIDLAFLQWRRKVDATTIPSLLKTTTEIRIYQGGLYPTELLTVLSEQSNPHLFHRLKQSSQVLKSVAKPIASCYFSLYQNGVWLGDLTFYPEQNALGAGRFWATVPAELTTWLRTRKHPGAYFVAHPAPVRSPYSVPYRKGHMAVKSKRVPYGIIFYGVPKP